MRSLRRIQKLNNHPTHKAIPVTELVNYMGDSDVPENITGYKIAEGEFSSLVMLGFTNKIITAVSFKAYYELVEPSWLDKLLKRRRYTLHRVMSPLLPEQKEDEITSADCSGDLSHIEFSYSNWEKVRYHL